MNLDLSTAIYHKYYIGAKNAGLFWTIWDWTVRHNPSVADTDEEEIERLIYSNPHREAITTVLTYEITIYVFRHLNGPWGEVVDHTRKLRSRFIHDYLEETGYEIVGNTAEFW